ncbi:unnamed protein product [Ectocarpus sp. CCAP 1310/34]|nr:unnamed protein product [Ectocarpus sp. CCAP 1310/34]
MDNSVETTTTLRGRHTKVPAKYQHNGSLGAAVGGGGLLSSTPNPLPGFKGTARSNTGGASDTNTQSEGVAGGPGHVAPTASAQQRTGTRSAADHRAHEVDAILQNARFNSTSDGGSIRVGSSSSDSGNSDSESEDDDRGRQHGRGAGGADGGSSSGAGGVSSSGAGGVSSRGAGGGRLSRAGSSAAVESVARTMRWSAYLLREACALRRLSGYSRSKDTDKMAARLTQLDIVMSRSSPYLADLEDKATGEDPMITRQCSWLQLSKKELDAKQKGTTRDIHLEILEAFKDEKFKVPSSFADDSNIFGAGINPNVVHQPDISFQKFATMRTDLFKDHGEMYSNFKKSGSNGEMFSFCKESLDTYYFGLTAEKCPDILAVCDQMLPDGTARESTGVETAGDGHSGAQGASADASKRKVAKVESRERNVGVSGHQKKKKKQDAQIENTAKVAISAVKGELGLDALFGTSSAPTYADAPTSFYGTKEGKEKELGSDADEEDLQLLRDRATTVRAQIRKETAAASEDG